MASPPPPQTIDEVLQELDQIILTWLRRRWRFSNARGQLEKPKLGKAQMIKSGARSPGKPVED